MVAYMGALKAGATVGELKPHYPPERQKILLDVARPRFLVYLQRANEEFGQPSDYIMDFIVNNLTIKPTVTALELFDNGELSIGNVDGKDCLESQASGREELPNVLVGLDSVPTLSFTSGSEDRPKGVQGRHFSPLDLLPTLDGREIRPLGGGQSHHAIRHWPPPNPSKLLSIRITLLIIRKAEGLTNSYIERYL